MKQIFKLLLLINSLIFTPINGAISLVYNIRIASLTRNPKIVQPYTMTFTPSGAYGKTRNGIKTGLAGYLQMINYAHNSFFAKVDFAIGEAYQVAQNAVGGLFQSGSNIQTFNIDDLLFKFGYMYSPTQDLSFSFTGYFGIPTHQDYVLQFFALGYGHVGLGLQIDSQFIYSKPQENMIKSAFRIIQFVPRSAISTSNNQIKRYKIDLGTLIDVFISHQSIFGSHTVEFGYDQIFFVNGKIRPFLQDALEVFNFISPNFFGTYSYALKSKNINHIFLAGISAGFDIWPKRLGEKIIIESWISYIINF